MNREWQRNSEFQAPTAVATLPPVIVEESGWDVLLALHWFRGTDLDLKKLCGIASVPFSVLMRWLAVFEDANLIAAVKNTASGEFRAVLTQAGNEMLHSYLSSVNALQAAAR